MPDVPKRVHPILVPGGIEWFLPELHRISKLPNGWRSAAGLERSEGPVGQQRLVGRRRTTRAGSHWRGVVSLPGSTSGFAIALVLRNPAGNVVYDGLGNIARRHVTLDPLWAVYEHMIERWVGDERGKAVIAQVPAPRCDLVGRDFDVSASVHDQYGTPHGFCVDCRRVSVEV
jgi:hypothetical protein